LFLKVISNDTIRQITYDFLFLFHSNTAHRFRYINQSIQSINQIKQKSDRQIDTQNRIKKTA